MDDLGGTPPYFWKHPYPSFSSGWSVADSVVPPGVPATAEISRPAHGSPMKNPSSVSGSSQFFGNEQMGGSRIHKTWGYKNVFELYASDFQAFIYFGQVWLVKCQNFVCFSDVRGFKPRFFEMPPRKQSVTLKIASPRCLRISNSGGCSSKSCLESQCLVGSPSGFTISLLGCLKDWLISIAS